MKPAPPKQLVELDTAADLLCVSMATLYRILNRREIRPVKIGRRTLVDVEDINAYIESCKNPAFG